MKTSRGLTNNLATQQRGDDARVPVKGLGHQGLCCAEEKDSVWPLPWGACPVCGEELSELPVTLGSSGLLWPSGSSSLKYVCWDRSLQRPSLSVFFHFLFWPKFTQNYYPCSISLVHDNYKVYCGHSVHLAESQNQVESQKGSKD